MLINIKSEGNEPMSKSLPTTFVALSFFFPKKVHTFLKNEFKH